jgi:predicted ribosome quality control (RQC) complex YloA/Tae2 family protein
MKKAFIFIFVLFLISFTAFSEEVILDNGKKIEIPDSYEALKEAYIKIINAYVEAEEDLNRVISLYENALVDLETLQSIYNEFVFQTSVLQSVNSKLLEQNTNMQGVMSELLDQNVNLTKLLDTKIRREFIQGFVLGGFYQNMESNTTAISLGFGLNLFEKASFSISYLFPQSIYFNFGIKIF